MLRASEVFSHFPLRFSCVAVSGLLGSLGKLQRGTQKGKRVTLNLQSRPVNPGAKRWVHVLCIADKQTTMAFCAPTKGERSAATQVCNDMTFAESQAKRFETGRGKHGGSNDAWRNRTVAAPPDQPFRDWDNFRPSIDPSFTAPLFSPGPDSGLAHPSNEPKVNSKGPKLGCPPS